MTEGADGGRSEGAGMSTFGASTATRFCTAAGDGEPVAIAGEHSKGRCLSRAPSLESRTMAERTRYWFDTEFMEDGHTIELLSIGVVCEDGREFYAESQGADYSKANEWVQTNVLPHLWSRQADKREGNRWSRDGGAGGFLSRHAIAGDLRRWVAEGEGKPEFWAYYGDYDWVVLCQLYGRMIDLPEGWPMFAMDVKQLCVSLGDPKLPEQTGTEHHALADARWTRDAWTFLTARAEQQPNPAPAPDTLGAQATD